MPETKAVDLINELSSGDRSKEEYIDGHDMMLDDLDRIDEVIDQIEISDVDDFRNAMEKKGILSSLFCYTYNNDKDEFERVSEIEGKLGDKLYEFARDFRKVKDSELRSVLKYLITCWDKYFRLEDREKMIRFAAENGKLRKETSEGYNGKMRTSYYVIGLHYAVGDNTYTESLRGNWNQNYVKSCAIQAFPVKSRFRDTVKELEEDSLEIPELKDFYKVTGVRSRGKERATVYLSRKDKRVVRKNYRKNYTR